MAGNAANTDLKDYIAAALSHGSSPQAIVNTLTQQGWGEVVVRKTLAQFCGVDTHGIPIPAPRLQAHHLARDIFIYLLIFVALCLSALAVGLLGFEWVDRLLLNQPSSPNHLFRWLTAQLLVTLPLYALLSVWVQQDLQRHPEKRQAFVRKGMIYLILFVNALIVLGHGVLVLYGVLSGDLTLRSLWHGLLVMGLVGGIFAYYYHELRTDDRLVTDGLRQEGEAATD